MSANWERAKPLIDGVLVKRTRHIVTSSSVTTELFRTDWEGLEASLEQAMQVNFHPLAISAWHHHKKQVDHFFVVRGRVKLVLFDDRKESPTKGQINVFLLAGVDPCLVRIPNLVWHGLQNMLDEPGVCLNFTNPAYRYDDPDEWRVPSDSPSIPYTFQ